MIYRDIIDGLMVNENRKKNYGVNVVMTRRDSRFACIFCIYICKCSQSYHDLTVICQAEVAMSVIVIGDSCPKQGCSRDTRTGT